jgi:hypothetical protein
MDFPSGHRFIARIYCLHGQAFLSASRASDVDESEEITVAVRADDLLEGETLTPCLSA